MHDSAVADVFDVAPSQVMLVAAHKSDLLAAKACGLELNAYLRYIFTELVRSKNSSALRYQ